MQEYIVKQGDTLNKIANKFGYGNYKQAGLVAKSGNPDLIRPGEVYSINPSATSPRDAFASNIGSSPSPSTSMTETDTPVASPAKTDYLKTYRDYLSKYAGSLQEDPNVTAARTNLNELEDETDETSLAARKAYEDLIHTSGGTKGGALESGSVSNRNNSYVLANLGVAQSGAARKLDALTGTQTAKQNFYKTAAELAKPIEVGDSYIDPTTGEVVYQKPKADKKKVLTNDVNAAVSQLGQIVKAKGFKGVSPDDYNTMRAYLQQEYGYEGVKELDSALAILGLSVDYGDK